MKNRPSSAPKTAQAVRPAARRQKPRVLAQSLSRFGSAAAVTAALLGSASMQAPATTYYWDTDGSDTGNSTAGANLGGTGNWDLVTSNWWDATNPLAVWGNGTGDVAIFTSAFTPLPTASTVTLSTGIIANQLRFNRSGYTLTGGDLTLAGTNPSLYAELGEYAVIGSQITGSAGLMKAGGGTVRLTDSTNNYTGSTIITNGTLVITDQAQLGSDSSAIVVRGFGNNPGAVTNLRGMGGGSLVLDGSASGLTISRDLSLMGQGPIADRGGALISTGNNTLSGTVSTGNASPISTTAINTTLISAFGNLTLSGTLNVQGAAGTTVTVLGGTNSGGVGGTFDLTGVLTGTGTLSKQGGGTLFLNPSSTAGFSGIIRTNGSNAFGQSTIRITNPNVLGTRTTTLTSSVLDLNGGILEVLMDSPSVLAGGSAARVYGRSSTVIFADHAIGSSALNGTLTLGELAFEENQTFTFNSRNGYGMTFAAAPVQGGNAGSTFNNNLVGGLLTFTGNFWQNTDGGASRTLTFGGNGDTLLSGNLLAASGVAGVDHVLTKGGSGTLTLAGTGATLDGVVNVNGGTLALADFRSITNTASTNINIGSGGTSGTISVVGNNATIGNLTTSRVVNMSGTTGGVTILANQTGTSPGLIFNSAITNAGGGTKTLVLGGTNTGDNTLNGAIPNGGIGGTATTNVTKIGTGTWILGGTNTYTGTTSVNEGTLKVRANAATSTILTDTSTLAFNATNVGAAGTLEFVGQNGVNNVETIGRLNGVAGSGTIQLTPGTGGTASLVFSGFTVGTNLADNATINIAGSNGTTNIVTLTGVATGLVQPNLYFGGDNFARSNAGVLVAPVYGTDATFVNAPGAATLPAGQNNFSINGNITAQPAQTVSTLKFNGGQTLTLNGGVTLTVRTGVAGTDGGILVNGGASVITGGTGITTGSTGALMIRVNGASDSLTLNSPLTSGTTGGVTKSGLGTLFLGGANAQTGSFSINEGTVELMTGASLSGASSTLNIRQGASLILNGVSTGTSIGQINTAAGGTISAGSSNATLTVGGGNGAGTLFGVMQDGAGVLSVIKNGTANHTWTGINTYTGGTTINSTGLITAAFLGNGGAPSSIGASGSAASNLIFGGSSPTLAFSGLNYAGTAAVSTDRLFTINGGVNGGVRLLANGVNSVPIVWSNPGAIVFSGASTTNPQAIVFAGGSVTDNWFAPQITDAGSSPNVTSVFKQEGGTWVLGNTANSYTGNTTINQGRLIVAGANAAALPTTSPLVFTAVNADLVGGVIEANGTISRSVTITPTAGTGTISFLPDGAGRSGSGGFAASTSKLTVDLGPQSWNSNGFLMAGSAAASLRLGSITSMAEVDYVSSIALDGAVRTIQVDDNGNVGTDFATISGLLSNGTAAAGINKTGGGTLHLSGANTYTGATTVSAGALIVHSLGNTATPGATSVGDSTLGNTAAGAIILGNGVASPGILEYVGAGETSDRLIRINSTGSTQIHADGAGPLVLTNVANDMLVASQTKTLFLRGTSIGNKITSVLADNGGPLAVAVDSSASWTLTGANTYTGTTTASAGALGIGNNSALGTSTLLNSNGNVFAYGEDRTLTNAVQFANNTTNGFLGDYSLTFTSPLTNLSGANNTGLNNSIVAGKALTFGGMTTNALTANRTLTVDGPGHTIINGDISTTTTFGLALTKTGNGVLELRGNSAANIFTQNNTGIDIDRGTLRIGANEVIPHAGTSAAFGGVTFSPEAATENDVAILDLNGNTETITVLSMNTAGTATIDNTSTNAASLVFGHANGALTFGNQGPRNIVNSGGGALSITKAGTAAATIPINYNLNYSGTTTVSNGSLTIQSPVNGTTNLVVSNNISGPTALNLLGGITSSAVTSVTVENNATLSLLDGAGNRMQNLTNLQLGNTGGSMTTLNFNVGDIIAGDQLNTDLLSLSSGTLSLFSGNQITLNLTDTGLNPLSTYVLLDATAIGGGFLTGPLALGDYILGSTPGGFTSIDLSLSTDNQILLTTGSLITGASYWRGFVNNTWNANAQNWVTDKAGGTFAASIPGQGTDVVFVSDPAGGGTVATTLEQNFKINSLVFEASSSATPNLVTVAPGVSLTNRLEIAPQSSTAGIAITTSGPAIASISAPVRLTGDQTWTVADATSNLRVTGELQGGNNLDLAKEGLGRVTLGAAAASTFNTGTAVANININAGSVEILNVGALGTVANSNLANVNLNGGAFYYTNGTAGTVPNPLLFNGGALSAGGTTQTYSGTVNAAAPSTINMISENGEVLATSTIARSINLTGIITGTAAINVNSITTLSAGNPFSGTLTLSNNNSGWSGGLFIDEGTVAATNVDALGTGDIGADNGRLILNAGNGATFNLAQDFTLNNGGNGIFEISADNSAGTPTLDMTGNFNGVVTLNGGSTNALRLFQATDNFSVLNITNSVVLGNNASISVGGSATRPATISGVISESSAGLSLTVNDDLGGWGTTNGILRLTGLNTYTGNTTVTEGVLEYDTVTGISGAPSALGQGSAISVGAATLRFIGSASQTTDRPITQFGAATYSANGTGGASIDYAGFINADNGGFGTAAHNITLTGLTGSDGILSGGFVQPGTSADTLVLGATWTITGSSTVADDLTVQNNGAILNVNTVDSLHFGASTENTVTINNGGVVNINASQTAASTFFDRLFIAQSGTGAATLNLGANDWASSSVGRIILGERPAALTGAITGTGILTIASGDFDLYRGSISAGLASTGTAGSVEKLGPGPVVLSGNNSGISATAATIIHEGTLELLYITDNNTKLRAASNLDMRGSTLVINGNNGAATSQSVGGFVLTSGGSNVVDVNGGTGQDAVLNLNAISRTNSTGTVRFELPTGAQTSTNGVTTTSPNSIYGLLGTGAAPANVSAYATVNDGTGTHFATNVAGNVVAVTEAVKDDVTTWSTGEHISDSAGFTGVVDCIQINSLRFDAAGGSDLNVATGGVLSIASGGILITSNVSSGTPSLMGGTLTSQTGEILVTQDSGQAFEIGADIRALQGITKSGNGILELSGNNTGTGQVTILQGTVQASGGAAIGDTSIVSIAANRASTLQLLNNEAIGRLTGGNATVNSNFGTIALGSNTLTINNSGSNTTYAGVFTGTGDLVRQGTHNLALSGVSTGYTGDVTINTGLLQLLGLGQLNASSFTVNAGGLLLIDNNTTTRTGARILDTTPITLNSANGSFQGATTVRGLAIRTDQNATTNETIGNLNFASGASYLSGDASGTTGVAQIIANNFVRTNNATVNARGRAMGLTAGDRNQFRIGNATNETNFINSMIGGASTSGATLSIVPWAIGERTAGGLGDTHMGNSLVTYTPGAGFRALDHATDYVTFAGVSTATHNVRESRTTDLTGLASTTVNSLVLHNDNVSSVAAPVNFSGTGAGQALTVTSGAMLFTTSSTATALHGISTNLNGFDNGVAVGASNEYVISVVNPSAAANTAILTATIGSPLTSTADITKSGRGTLILTGINTAGGGSRRTTLNEGILEISDLDNIGGNTGSLVFAGGTIRLGSAFVDDLTTRSISYQNGGGTINTNGLNPTFAGSIGSGAGGLTKAGAGILTLNGAATYGGETVISAGSIVVGANNATGVGGNLTINGGTGIDLGVNSVTHGLVTTQGASPLITGTGTINASSGFFLNHTGNTTIDAVLAGAGGLIKAQSNIVTLTGANTYTGTTEVVAGQINFSTIANVGGGASNLGAPTTVENGIIRTGLGGTGATLNYTGAGSTSDRIIAMQGTTGGLVITQSSTASGALNLGTIQTETPGVKTLTINGGSTAANSIALIHECASGALSVTKAGTGTWVLTGANNYIGNTLNSGGGVLRAANSQAFGTVGTVTIQDTGTVLELADSVNINRPLTVSNAGNAKTLRLFSGATSATYSGNVSIAEQTAGNFVVDVPTGTLSSTGVISSTGATALAGITKIGTGTLSLTGVNTYRGVSAINDGVVNIQHATALGATNEGTTVAAGATLQVEGGIAVGAEALTLNGTGETGQNGALVNVTGSNSWAGNLTLGSASTISTDDGFLTISGNVTLGANTLTSTGDNGGQTVISGDISGAGGLVVSAISAAQHTLTLDPATTNSFTGSTTINADATLTAQDAGALGGTSGVTVNTGGTLLLAGTGDRVNDSASMTLAGGTLNTAGLVESVGTLTLTLGSVIDLAGGSSLLTFADSSASWGNSLQIWNWTGTPGVTGGTDQLLFTSTLNIDTNLTSISFYSDGGSTLIGFPTIRIGNEVLPVPEPTGVAIGLALFGLAGWRERRRSTARRRDERAASRP